MIGFSEDIKHRAAKSGIAVKHTVQQVRRKLVGQSLGTRPVADPQEGIVGGGEANAFLCQLPLQPAVTIAVELQTEGRPCRNPQIDQAQFGIHEVEIIVQALAAAGAHIGVVRLLVVPRLIRAAGLHGGNHMHQSGMIATPLKHLGNDSLLADMRIGNELDCDTGFLRQGCRPIPYPVTQAFRKLRIIKDAPLVRAQKFRHPLCVAHRWQRPGDNNPVITGQNSGNLVAIAFNQRLAHLNLPGSGREVIPFLVPACPG